MSCVVQIIGLAVGGKTALDGMWLVEYDPERDGVSPDGRPMNCHIEATYDRSAAKVFSGLPEAHVYIYRVSRRSPFRPGDGAPNRPLSAYTLCIEKLK